MLAIEGGLHPTYSTPPSAAANASEFAKSVDWVTQNLSFDLNDTVSVFETNIRVLGACSSPCAVPASALCAHLRSES